MVKVLIKRVVPKNKASKMISLFKQMHILAVNQEGYVSAETFNNLNDPDEFLVISTWQSVDDWKAWEASKDRIEIQEQIDRLLGEKTACSVYYYPHKSGARLSGFKGWEGG